jgi:hypothetical protein
LIIKNNKSQPLSNLKKKIGPQCLMRLPSTLAIGWDMGNDGEALVHLALHYATQRVKRQSLIWPNSQNRPVVEVSIFRWGRQDDDHPNLSLALANCWRTA